MPKDISPVSRFASEAGIRFERDFPLSGVSSFKTGGRAQIALFPSDGEGLASLVRFLKKEGVRYDVFGNTTNVLFDDGGYSGAVIFTKEIRGIRASGENEVYSSAGEPLSRLCRFFSENGLTGGEALYGIPGSVGGAIYMNAGAYEHSISEIITRVDVYDPSGDRFMSIDGGDMDFSYRHSACEEKGYIVLGASFRLCPDEREKIEERMENFMRLRREKQPLEYPSAGSVFKRYPGRYTAKMIDECGLKGTSVGGAQVSEKHAGFIINKGGAKSSDVLELINLVKEKIRGNFGIDIECEIRIIESGRD